MRIRLEHLEKEFDGVPVLRGIDFDDDVTDRMMARSIDG